MRLYLSPDPAILGILLLAALLLTSCAPALSVEMRRQAADVEIIEGTPDRDFVLIVEVEGRSCAVQTGSDPSLEGARASLKLAGAKVDAQAVVQVFCEERGTDILRNCWKQYVCLGDAVRWK